MMKKRVFLLVLDSVGIGNAPDAALFGDEGAHTLRSISRCANLHIPTLLSMGIGNIQGAPFAATDTPTAAVARLQEYSLGKDTTTGHWELAGHVSKAPFPTYPHGFPDELMAAFSRETGRGILCNKPYSGTAVIADYGEEHLRTGNLIVYTSADSVFQVAAHEDIVPPDRLYDYCRIARRLLTREHAVGRVIARPFSGQHPFTRTERRRDFSLVPPPNLLPEQLKNAGLDCIGVGKIGDIFAQTGITESFHTHSNEEGMARTEAVARRDFHGLCFVNLVDFDMLYGHRNDVDGYAAALSAFDRWLAAFLPTLGSDDALIITADHGCDPAFAGTDHTREMVPFLLYGDGIVPENRGTLPFGAVATTVKTLLGVL